MSAFRATRFQVTHEEKIKTTPDACFALACPVEELKWINNWQFDMIYSDSGRNEINCIFREDMSAAFVLNVPGLSTYWQTTLYDAAEHRFHALLMYGDKATGKFEWEVKDDGDGICSAIWNLTYTALNQEGNDIADESLKDRMSLMLDFLAKSGKHYLETGEMLK